MKTIKIMKNKILCLLAGLVAFSSAELRAEDAKPQPRPSREEMREKFKNMTPEEREAKIKEWKEKNPNASQGGRPGGGQFDPEKAREEMKETAKQLGLNPEELKNLPPEERRAKVREAADKKTEELKKKKADGTLTEEDKKLAERLEKMRDMRKRFEEGRPPGGSGGKGDARDARKPAPPESGDKK